MALHLPFVIVRVLLIFLCLLSVKCLGQPCLEISSSFQSSPLAPYQTLHNQMEGAMQLKEVCKKVSLPIPQSLSKSRDSTNQWLTFTVDNTQNKTETVYLTIAFVDEIKAYIVIDSSLQFQQTGDLLPLSKRETKTGQLCFISFVLPSQTKAHCFLHLASKTAISSQFRSLTLKSGQVYGKEAYTARFETSRIHQALFYGAIFIMLFYNLFIYATTLSSSYLSYVKFLFCVILFMSSTNGYVFELLLPHHPRLDLYIRFLSTPLLLFSYLIFAKHYLEVEKHAPLASLLFKVLLVGYVLIGAIMVLGGWKLGRSLTIPTSVFSFVFVLLVAIKVLKTGFTPAKYFIGANFLLIIGAVLYAMERYEYSSQNHITQYSVQISIVFQSIFFSIGLADRIKLTTQRITAVEQEKVKLEQLRITERRKFVEEKNKALEKSNQELDAFIYKTAHDIKGPIARLLGLSQLGLMDVRDEQSLKYFSLLKNNAEYLNYLLNRLSTAYEIKNQEVIKTHFEISKLVKDVLTSLSFHEDFKEVNFTLKIESDTMILSDYSLLRFALLNLLDNAIKFRKREQESNMDITVEGHVDTRGNLKISVRDFGIGVNENEIPYLFDMFSKAATRYQNPGLGLYMAKLGIEKLNGTITLTNPGNPTVFEIDMPA